VCVWWTGRDLNPRPPPLSGPPREGGVYTDDQLVIFHAKLNYRPNNRLRMLADIKVLRCAYS
jgi:hypothetical protein